MTVSPKDVCIFIASHMSKSNRILYLMECLDSLIYQHVPVSIYLSISFENPDIQSECMDLLNRIVAKTQCEFLNITIRPQKTPQMRHFHLLYDEFGEKHTWFMFCDDDDTYTKDRTDSFIKAISHGLTNTSNKHMAGVYESISGNNHTKQRHEYWCYCVNTDLLSRFFETVAPHPLILNDTCCDVLFGEYLRRLSPDWSFVMLHKHCYHYRVDQNADSITQVIQSKHGQYHPRSSAPPATTSPEWATYVIEWNDFLRENMHIYLHDTYLRTLVGYSFDQILQYEFISNYYLLEYIDQPHIEKMADLHANVISVCEQLYDVPTQQP
jgi:hypothetical protein